MLRISRLTDYAFILLARLPDEAEGGPVSCSSLAKRVPLPLPTVRKVLKTLAQAELLTSTQGAHGGYALARAPAEITVAEVIEAMEGPIALTLCSEGEDECDIEKACPVSSNWRLINQAITETLDGLTLADMNRDLDRRSLTVTVQGSEAEDASRSSDTPAGGSPAQPPAPRRSSTS